jgi:hypothetical protein
MIDYHFEWNNDFVFIILSFLRHTFQWMLLKLNCSVG